MKPFSIDTPVEYIKGIGPTRAELLKRELKIYTFDDLITHYPFRYVDRTKFYKIGEIHEELPYVQLRGIIIKVQSIGEARQKRLVASFKDDTGIIELVWFRGIKWLLDVFKTNVEYVVFGKPNRYKNKFSIAHPEIEPVTDENTTFARTLRKG